MKLHIPLIMFFVLCIVKPQKTNAQSPYKQGFGIRMQLDSISPIKMEYKRFFGTSNWSCGTAVGLGHRSGGVEFTILRNVPWIVRNIKIPGWRWAYGLIFGGSIIASSQQKDVGYYYISLPIGIDNVSIWNFNVGGVYIGNYLFYEPRWYNGTNLSNNNSNGVDWLNFSIGVRFILGTANEKTTEFMIK